MKTLVLGASGATGRLLVDQLIRLDQEVKAVVRPTSQVPSNWEENDRITIIRAHVSDMSVDEMSVHLKDCMAAASCLGHNLNLKGIYGKPRKLVRDSVILCCTAAQKNDPGKPFRLALMNTTANSNKDLKEKRSVGEKLVIGLIRLLLPPQTDNEQAAEYLRKTIGQDHPSVEWVAVRPDTLIDEDVVSDYKVFPSPVRSAVFNAGKTSRVNVGNFIARLIAEDELWNTWKGQMPVLYNKEN